MKTHKDLDVWKISMDLVTHVYKITQCFPKEEMYGLASQMRRSAVSIPSNIAEGAGRNSDKEFMQFLYYAMGSLAELETQIIISYNLNYISIEVKNTLLEETTVSLFRMLSGLINAVKRKINK